MRILATVVVFAIGCAADPAPAKVCQKPQPCIYLATVLKAEIGKQSGAGCDGAGLAKKLPAVNSHFDAIFGSSDAKIDWTSAACVYRETETILDLDTITFKQAWDLTASLDGQLTGQLSLQLDYVKDGKLSSCEVLQTVSLVKKN